MPVGNTCVTWQGIDYRLPEDDDSVETCRSVIICEIIVHLLVIVQNKKKTCLPIVVPLCRLVGWDVHKLY